MQICPHCKSEVSDTAKKCKYCGEWIKKETKSEETKSEEIKNKEAGEQKKGEKEIKMYNQKSWVKWAMLIPNIIILHIICIIVYTSLGIIFDILQPSVGFVKSESYVTGGSFLTFICILIPIITIFTKTKSKYFYSLKGGLIALIVFILITFGILFNAKKTENDMQRLRFNLANTNTNNLLEGMKVINFDNLEFHYKNNTKTRRNIEELFLGDEIKRGSTIDEVKKSYNLNSFNSTEGFPYEPIDDLSNKITFTTSKGTEITLRFYRYNGAYRLYHIEYLYPYNNLEYSKIKEFLLNKFGEIVGDSINACFTCKEGIMFNKDGTNAYLMKDLGYNLFEGNNNYINLVLEYKDENIGKYEEMNK